MTLWEAFAISFVTGCIGWAIGYYQGYDAGRITGIDAMAKRMEESTAKLLQSIYDQQKLDREYDRYDKLYSARPKP